MSNPPRANSETSYFNHHRTSPSGSGSSNNYIPAQPSQLREAHVPPSSLENSATLNMGSNNSEVAIVDDQDESNPTAVYTAEPESMATPQETPRYRGESIYSTRGNTIGNYSRAPSPPTTPPSPTGLSPYIRGIRETLTGRPSTSESTANGETRDGAKKRARKSTTQRLAERHGVRHTWLMYLYYYIPSLNWMRQYKWRFLTGDLAAALTMASFYIPMSLSYASNLAHVPPINGLYAFAVNPLVYGIFGSVPQMVVGPEAAGSLLTGNVVRDSIERGHAGEVDNALLAQIAGIVTGLAGLVLLLAGFARLGFLENVLSRPFLRGFISAIGFVIMIDQLIPELGLMPLAQKDHTVAHGSSYVKFLFVCQNIKKTHALTAAVSFGSFVVIMICRETKKRLQPRHSWVAYIPDRFLVVVITTILTWQLRWDKKGLSILGDIKSTTGDSFPIHDPFDFRPMKHIEVAMSTSFIIALLGFFESTVAAKSLGAGPPDGIKNMTLSANRELTALGLANVIGGFFMAIPAFGGYGRSKVNANTGGKTPMSSILLSFLTILCVLFALPWFHYIPRGVLSAMVTVVAYSLVEEAPHDLRFFFHIRGWTELFLVFLVFLATIFYSLPLGIACGIGFSLLRVIKHSTRPRIQILGRVHGTSDQFENAEADPDSHELIEGCLIVKIPEPLTFANTGALRSRLRKLENYGALSAHPSLPQLREGEQNRNIIFDVHGVTSLDGAGAQVLLEIVEDYRARGVRIFFCRAPNPRTSIWRLMERSGIIEAVGGLNHFLPTIREALRMSEMEEVTDRFVDNPQAAEP